MLDFAKVASRNLDMTGKEQRVPGGELLSKAAAPGRGVGSGGGGGSNSSGAARGGWGGDAMQVE